MINLRWALLNSLNSQSHTGRGGRWSVKSMHITIFLCCSIGFKIFRYMMAFAMALNYAEMCQIWFHSLNTKKRLNRDLHIKFVKMNPMMMTMMIEKTFIFDEMGASSNWISFSYQQEESSWEKRNNKVDNKFSSFFNTLCSIGDMCVLVCGTRKDSNSHWYSCEWESDEIKCFLRLRWQWSHFSKEFMAVKICKRFH